MTKEVTEWRQLQISDVRELAKGLKIRELKNDEPIKQELRYIFAIIGLKNIPSKNRPHPEVPSEWEVLLDFILKTYPDLAVGELKNAFLLATQGKFIVDEKHGVKHFETFSCEYLGRVMTKYREFRQNELKKTRNKSLPSANKYSDFDDYLENELFLPYQKIRVGEKIEFSDVIAWRWFNWFRNIGLIVVDNPGVWMNTAEETLLKEKRSEGKVSYQPTPGEIDYKSRVLFFTNWIQEQAFSEVNLRELINEKRKK